MAQQKKIMHPLDPYFAMLDREIMLCDGPEQLAYLSSAMMASAVEIMNAISGPDKTRIVLYLALEELNMKHPPGAGYDKRPAKKKPKKDSNL